MNYYSTMCTYVVVCGGGGITDAMQSLFYVCACVQAALKCMCCEGSSEMYVVLMCGVQAALISVGKEKDQLVEQVQSLVAASQERDTLSQQLSSAQQLLQEAQVCAHVLFLSVFYIMRMYVHHKHRNVVYCGSCTSIHQSVTIDERSEPTHIHSCLNFDIPNPTGGVHCSIYR